MKDLDIAVQNHDWGFVAGRLGYQNRAELFIALGQWLIGRAEKEVDEDSLAAYMRAFINSKLT